MNRLVLNLTVGAASLLAAGAAALAGPAPTAYAVVAAAHRHDSRSGTSTSLNGADISYPQCGKAFPASPAFGIVGVNGGLANDLNPCFGPSSSYPGYAKTELYWAVASATGVTSQPKASLYLNTADPGNIYNGKPVTDWPTGGSTPYGSCATTSVTTSSGTYTVGQNSNACAWQYGYDRAASVVSRF